MGDTGADSMKRHLIWAMIFCAVPAAAQFGNRNWKAPVANAAALPTCNAGSDGHSRVTLDDGHAHTCLNGTGWVDHVDGGGGSAITFDIGDDGGNDSTDLSEIATTGDTNTIFTESSADKLLIAVGNNWPICDTANAGDSATAFFTSGEIADAQVSDTLTVGSGGSVNAGAVGADHIDTITEIAAPLKTGADGTVVTGTAGATDECAKWDANGDLITAGAACGAGVP